MEWPTTRTGDT